MPPYFSPAGAAGVVGVAVAVVLEVVGGDVAGALVAGVVVAEGTACEQARTNIEDIITSIKLKNMAFNPVPLRMVETSNIKFKICLNLKNIDWRAISSVTFYHLYISAYAFEAG